MFVVAVPGLSSAQALLAAHRLSTGDLFWPGVEPISPALAGGFFTTEPPGKPKYNFKILLFHYF